MEPQTRDSTGGSGATRRVVLVTGPSGAGRSTALNVLEDIGFETIDNLPLRLLPELVTEGDAAGLLALGIDVRNRDFSTDGVLALLSGLGTEVALELLYLDCADETLLRRYSETRRRHPLAPDDRPIDGVAREQTMLAPIRAQADVLIDTSDLNVHELRAEVERWFAPDGKHPMSVSVQSFSYKRGLPRSVDNIFDCRFLRNPYWQPSLRHLTGMDAAVFDYVQGDARYAAFANQIEVLSNMLLPAYQLEGKSHISIAFGCTGGRHRSVTVARDIGLRLAHAGWQVSIMHRELDRHQAREAHT